MQPRQVGYLLAIFASALGVAICIVRASLSKDEGAGDTPSPVQVFVEVPTARPETPRPLRYLESDSGPLEFVARTIDLGSVAQGGTYAAEFQFRNAGDSPISELKFRPNCACTVAQQPPGDIAPGAVHTVRFNVAPGQRSGAKTVTVEVQYLADEIRHGDTLQVHFETHPASGLEPVPATLTIGTVTVGDQIELRTRLRQTPLSREVARPLSVNGPDWLACEFTEAANGEWELTCRGVAPPIAGSVGGMLRVTTDAPSHPIVTIPIEGHIRGSLSSVPATIVHVARSPDIATIDCEIVDALRRDGATISAEPLQLTGGTLTIVVAGPGASPGGQRFRIVPSLELTAGRGMLRGELRFTIHDGGRTESVRVPLLILVRPQ